MVAPLCSTSCGATPPSAVVAAAVIAGQLHNDDVAGQIIPSGAATHVEMPVLGFEIGNIEVDTVTDEIVILVSGLYQLTFFGWWAPNAADGLVALSLVAPAGTTFPLAPPSDEMDAADVANLSQHSTTFGVLEAGQRYSLLATQVSGETRTLIFPMLSIVKV